MNPFHITNALQTRPSRRAALRGLLGAALGLAVLRQPENGEAKKRKKRKKKNKNTQVCAPGTSVGTVKVPATGATVSTPTLAVGQRYRLQATGFWNTNATYGNDAFAAFKFATPTETALTYQNVRVGLSVSGGSPDEWGNYNITHNYERGIIGEGAPLTLNYTDPGKNDNSGTVTVNIVCA